MSFLHWLTFHMHWLGEASGVPHPQLPPLVGAQHEQLAAHCQDSSMTVTTSNVSYLISFKPKLILSTAKRC